MATAHVRDSFQALADAIFRSTTIDWIGTLDAKGAPEADAKRIVEGIYRGAIAASNELLGS